jgi:hypothetical protein
MSRRTFPRTLAGLVLALSLALLPLRAEAAGPARPDPLSDVWAQAWTWVVSWWQPAKSDEIPRSSVEKAGEIWNPNGTTTQSGTGTPTGTSGTGGTGEIGGHIDPNG